MSFEILYKSDVRPIRNCSKIRALFFYDPFVLIQMNGQIFHDYNDLGLEQNISW